MAVFRSLKHYSNSTVVFVLCISLLRAWSWQQTIFSKEVIIGIAYITLHARANQQLLFAIAG